jgi:hypothetical protein
MRSVTVNVERFAEVLADRLAAVTPDGFQVRYRDGLLRYTCDEGRFPGQTGDYQPGSSGTYALENFGTYGEAEEDNLAGLARQALDELQDYVSEASHNPWPGTSRQPPAHAEVRGSALHLWYGEPDAVVLACDPIPLAEIS